jgi:hypothetical protein
MSYDYKNKLPDYLTEEKFDDWLKTENKGYGRLLKMLGVSAHEHIRAIFEGDDHLLKFFWFKLLTIESMPANSSGRNGFDCDKAFFGKLDGFSPSELLNNWQRERPSWSADTINSYAQLFKRFLILYLEEEFKGQYDTSLNGKWCENLIKKMKQTNSPHKDIIESYGEANRQLSEIRLNKNEDKNQLRLYSFFIVFQKEILRHLRRRVKPADLRNMLDFAKLTHTPGNFMLVKSWHENQRKNNKYGDFMDKYIEEQNEAFIKAQHLYMYKEPMFKRKGKKEFPSEISFPKCIQNIKDNIREREEILQSNA